MAGDWQSSCCTPGPSTALVTLIKPDSVLNSTTSERILGPRLIGNKFEKRTDLKGLSSIPLACRDGDLMAENNLLRAY